MAAKGERREALSIPEAREGRGSEHGVFDYAARSCTSGIDRRSRTEPRVRPETNVERKKSAEGCKSDVFLRLPAAKPRMAQFGKWQVLIVERFDRLIGMGMGSLFFDYQVKGVLYWRPDSVHRTRQVSWRRQSRPCRD